MNNSAGSRWWRCIANQRLHFQVFYSWLFARYLPDTVMLLDKTDRLREIWTYMDMILDDVSNLNLFIIKGMNKMEISAKLLNDFFFFSRLSNYQQFISFQSQYWDLLENSDFLKAFDVIFNTLQSHITYFSCIFSGRTSP